MTVPDTSFIDNALTPAPQADVGIKISKPGYDANTAAGANMVFDSSWPSLPIILRIAVDFADINTPIPHKLGFPPFAMAWCYGDDQYGSTTPGATNRFIPSVDATNIYLKTVFPIGVVAPTYVMVLVYALDISKDIDYKLAPGSTFNLSYDNSYGFKIVKPGKNIDSKDMRDFSIHSRCQSPLIQAIKTEATRNPNNDRSVGTPTSTIQYTNRGIEPVWVYGYLKIGTVMAASLGVPVGTYRSTPLYSQGYPRMFTDGITSYISYIRSGANADLGASIVVLRDPLFAATQSTVQY